jgi:membrane fusion protein, multidrug efflux system
MHTKRPTGPMIKESYYLIRVACFLMALALGPLSLNACSSGKAEQATSKHGAKSESVPVVTGVVTQKDVPVQLRVIGAVEAYSVVAVKPQVSGELTKAHFTEGQFVKRATRYSR